MLYAFLKLLVRTGFIFYYKRIYVGGQQHIPNTGPLLFVANHPNSFMDALVVATQTKRKMHFLARGDAFNSKILNAIFRSFNMLPVYRASEGKENINKNINTFDAVHQALLNKEAVLIFGEGICENNWDLRPQKKGAARIAQRAWNTPEIADLKVVPVGITYEHFNGGGKSVVLNFGEAFDKYEIRDTTNFVQQFNQHIITQTIKLAYINPALKPNTKAAFIFNKAWSEVEKNPSNFVQQLYNEFQNTTHQKLTLSTTTGWHKLLVTWPHYKAMQWLAFKTTKGNIFYDSVLFGLTVLLFPFYVLLIFGLIFLLL